jgi:hypothetical protein
MRTAVGNSLKKEFKGDHESTGLLSKYLSDLSKGLLLAAIVGWGSGKLRTEYVLIDIISAFYTIMIAYLLEGGRHDAAE